MARLIEYSKEEIEAIRSKVYKPFDLDKAHRKRQLPVPNLRPLTEAEIYSLRLDAYTLKFP